MVDIEDDTGIVTVDRHNLVAERVQHRTRAPIAAQPQKISKDGRAEGDWMGRAIGRADNRCGCAIDHGVEEGIGEGRRDPWQIAEKDGHGPG